MIKRELLLVALFILIPFWAEGKTLYVNNSGSPACSDATTYANNSVSNPWCTIGRAAWGSTNRSSMNSSEAAKAGDTVYVAAGTYGGFTGTGQRNSVLYLTANSGTPGNPITIEAQGTVVLEQMGEGPIIGASDGRNYINWKGFTIYEINALARSDTGPVILWDTTGSRIENCIIDGWDNGRLGNNHNGIRLEYAYNCVVRNNKIYNVLNWGTYGVNGAGIMVYYGSNNIFEHNEIYNCGSGIFLKGGNHTGNIIRYNYIYGCRYQIWVWNSNPSTGEPLIYQNIVRCTPSGPTDEDYGIVLADNAYRVKVVNNTIVNCNRNTGLWLRNSYSNVVQNNIIYQTQNEVISAGELSSQTNLTTDYNNYYSSNRWSIARQAYTSLSSWRTALGGCPGVGNDCNSTTSNPLFVNPSQNNYRLQSGSPCRNAGIDILDLNNNGQTNDPITIGAYITGNEVIGRISDLPLPPSGLRIQ